MLRDTTAVHLRPEYSVSLQFAPRQQITFHYSVEQLALPFLQVNQQSTHTGFLQLGEHSCGLLTLVIQHAALAGVETILTLRYGCIPICQCLQQLHTTNQHARILTLVFLQEDVQRLLLATQLELLGDHLIDVTSETTACPPMKPTANSFHEIHH